MATPTPPPSTGINNPFIKNGPKGFSEFKVLTNGDLFVRLDLPGVSADGVTVRLHESKKSVIISAHEPPIEERHVSYRYYYTMTGLVCECCEISNFPYQVSDGVLRITLSKTAIHPHRASVLLSLPDFAEDPVLMGPVMQQNPYVCEGSTAAYESNPLGGGKLHVRVDMPGVPEDNFTVFLQGRKVRVTGEAPAVSEDSSGRSYSADVAEFDPGVDCSDSDVVS